LLVPYRVPVILTQAAVQGWCTVRRYAVPAPMIRRATERRPAGDWRGACATFESGEPIAEWMEKARPTGFAALAPLLRLPVS
jgi:hypothetical protein